MSLAYDFDIVTIAQEGDDLEARAGAAPSAGVVRARFRDVKAADALRGASPRIRKIFLDAGFTLDTHGGGLSHGYFPPEDAAARRRILLRLFANLRVGPLRGEYCGEFSLRDFLAHVRTARPGIGAKHRAPDKRPKKRPPTDDAPKRTTVPGRIGFALGLAVLLFVLLKLLAATGTTP